MYVTSEMLMNFQVLGLGFRTYDFYQEDHLVDNELST
jgi:hypothetical protein